MRKLVIEYDETETRRIQEKMLLEAQEESKRERRLVKADLQGEDAYNKALAEEISKLTIFDFFENDELANANKDKKFTTLEQANIVVHSSFSNEIQNAYLIKLMEVSSEADKKLISKYIEESENGSINVLKKNPFNCIVELNVPFKPFDYIVIKDIQTERCVVADPNDPLVKRAMSDASLTYYDESSNKGCWVKLGVPNYFIEATDFSHTGRKKGEINASYRYQYYSFKLKDIERVSILDMTVREILMLEEIKKQAKEHAEKENWELNY